MANPNPKPFHMPAWGERVAPTFDRTKPRELISFFEELEYLFECATLDDEAKKKKHVLCYIDFDVEQLWKIFPEYIDATKSYGAWHLVTTTFVQRQNRRVRTIFFFGHVSLIMVIDGATVMASYIGMSDTIFRNTNLISNCSTYSNILHGPSTKGTNRFSSSSPPKPKHEKREKFYDGKISDMELIAESLNVPVGLEVSVNGRTGWDNGLRLMGMAWVQKKLKLWSKSSVLNVLHLTEWFLRPLQQPWTLKLPF
jgi:hypothetical protein